MQFLIEEQIVRSIKMNTENKKLISIKIDVEDLDYLKSNCDKYQRKIQQLIKKKSKNPLTRYV